MIMEYQKITNLLDNASYHPSEFKTKNSAKINYESKRVCNVNSHIKFKITMLKSSLCDYSDAYILAKGIITVDNTSAAGAAVNHTNKKVIFKSCAPFISSIIEMNST